MAFSGLWTALFAWPGVLIDAFGEGAITCNFSRDKYREFIVFGQYNSYHFDGAAVDWAFAVMEPMLDSEPFDRDVKEAAKFQPVMERMDWGSCESCIVAVAAVGFVAVGVVEPVGHWAYWVEQDRFVVETEHCCSASCLVSGPNAVVAC